MFSVCAQTFAKSHREQATDFQLGNALVLWGTMLYDTDVVTLSYSDSTQSVVDSVTLHCPRAIECLADCNCFCPGMMVISGLKVR